MIFKCKKIISCILFLSISIVPKVAWAVRPFITDDARVTDPRIFQMESWLQFNKIGFQHWAVFSIGLDKSEASIGLMYGRQDGIPIVESPLLQLKMLGLDTISGAFIPGMAFSIGMFPKKDSTEIFEYLAFTESLDTEDKYLIHQNIGLSSSYSNLGNYNKIIWGIGSQIYVYNKFYFINEIFSGDPYVGNSTSAFQLGSRYFISNLVQVDASFGKAIDMDSYVWWTLGCRLATNKVY